MKKVILVVLFFTLEIPLSADMVRSTASDGNITERVKKITPLIKKRAKDYQDQNKTILQSNSSEKDLRKTAQLIKAGDTLDCPDNCPQVSTIYSINGMIAVKMGMDTRNDNGSLNEEKIIQMLQKIMKGGTQK